MSQLLKDVIKEAFKLFSRKKIRYYLCRLKTFVSQRINNIKHQQRLPKPNIF